MNNATQTEAETNTYTLREDGYDFSTFEASNDYEAVAMANERPIFAPDYNVAPGDDPVETKWHLFRKNDSKYEYVTTIVRKVCP